MSRQEGFVPRGRLASIALAGVVGLLLTACAGMPGGPGTPGTPAETVLGVDCLAPNLGGWVLPPGPLGEEDAEHPDAPEPGRIPGGFEAVVAYRCDLMASIEDTEGRWSAVTVERFDGELARLLAALGEPDDARSVLPCTADAELVAPLWLADAAGYAVHAHYPRDGCGKTKPGVRDALAVLRVAETVTLKRDLVEPRAALDAGCGSEWTAPFAAGSMLAVPGEPSRGSDGIGMIPIAPAAASAPNDVDAMRWCRYAVGEPELESDPITVPSVAGEPELLLETLTLRTGRFVAGGILGTADAHQVLAAATAAPAKGSCEPPAREFIVLSPLQAGQAIGAPLTAELDGCPALRAEGSEPRPLPPELLTTLDSLGR